MGRAGRGLLVAQLCTALSALLWLLWRCRFGLDLTDEGFYLNWIAQPWRYDASVTQFGFVYHALYRLVGADIALLRQANVLITFGLAFALSAAVLRYVQRGAVGVSVPGFKHYWPFAALAAGVALTVVDSWRPTPNYNSLAFQALLLAGTGLALIEARPSAACWSGWSLLALGGALAFLAKPTTAAMLGLLCLSYLWAASVLRLRMFGACLALVMSLLLASALFIDGSLQGFIRRLDLGVEMARLLGGGHTADRFFSLQGFALSLGEGLTLGFLAMLTGLLSWAGQTQRPRVILAAYGLIGLSLFAGLAVMANIANMDQQPSRFHGMLICAAPLGWLTFTVLDRRSRSVPVERPQLAFAALLAALPHVCAFGTNSNYWKAAAFAGIFWLLAVIVLIGPLTVVREGWHALMPVLAVAQLTTVALLAAYMAQPYRQAQAIWAQTAVADFGSEGGQLFVSQDFADYLRTARATAAQAGFRPGDAVIDLSGHSPGTLFALGAHVLGQAWTIGGYQGSETLAAATLARLPCTEIGGAWLLTEPQGPRRLAPTFLANSGILVERDYQVAARWLSPAGMRGHSQAQIQQLLRPITGRKDAIERCLQSRPPHD